MRAFDRKEAGGDDRGQRACGGGMADRRVAASTRPVRIAPTSMVASDAVGWMSMTQPLGSSR